jgi:MATE family multidrug resistance protein
MTTIQEPNEHETWWTRPSGGREVAVLALPLILSTASWAVMHFVDRMFLLWHDPKDTAATLSSGMVLWSIMALPLGIASYVNTFVSQYYGAERKSRIGLVLFQGVVFGWVTVPLFLAISPFSAPAFRLMGHDSTMVRLESIYLQVNCWGAGAAVISAAYSSFYTGRGEMRIVMLIDIAASVIDATLNYVLIFGKFGFPEMGIAGAALSTVLAQWMKVVVYWWLLRAPELRETYGLDVGRRFDRALFWRLQRFGGPNGLQMQLEGLAFTVFVIYIARLGTEATAATTLALSINIVAFVPMIGIGVAVSTLLGQHLGAENPRLAARAVWSGLWLALSYNLLFASLYLFVPHAFLLIHESGMKPGEFTEIRSLTIILLRFVAAYCLFDAVQLIFSSAIKGAGDTRYVLIVTVVTSTIAIAMTEWGMARMGWGLMWCWTVLMLWVMALAVAYSGRFVQGSWKKMRVIEAEPEAIAEPEPEVASV